MIPELFPQDSPNVLATVAVQLSVGTGAAMMAAEWLTLPIGSPGASGIASRKRLNALVYSTAFAYLLWLFGGFTLPPLVIEGRSLGYAANVAIKAAFVIPLASLLSVLAAHVGHAMKRKLDEDLNHRNRPN